MTKLLALALSLSVLSAPLALVDAYSNEAQASTCLRKSCPPVSKPKPGNGTLPNNPHSPSTPR